MSSAAWAMRPPKGISKIVVVMLKIVCTFAICAAGLSGTKLIIQLVNGVTRQITVNTMVPMILNIRWMMVVRLALILVPMDASTAVMQVPIFCPNSTKTAPSRPMSPLTASAWRIPTDAEED